MANYLLRITARLIEYTLIFIQTIHVHIFIFLACFDSHWCYAIAFIGPFITSSCIVIIIQSVGVYNEIQSWEIAYIIWGLTMFVLCLTQSIITWKRIKSNGGQTKAVETIVEEVDEYWNKTMLKSFGVDAKSEGSSSNWSFALVSCAPAIVGGYIANYILEEKFELECSQNVLSEMCNNNVCCEIVSSHQNWFLFMGNIASSMLAAWAVVKATASFLLSIDDDIIIENKDKIEKSTELHT